MAGKPKSHRQKTRHRQEETVWPFSIQFYGPVMSERFAVDLKDLNPLNEIKIRNEKIGLRRIRCLLGFNKQCDLAKKMNDSP